MTQAAFSIVSLRRIAGLPTFGPTERKRAAIVAVSVLIHALILTPLAMRLFEPRSLLVADAPDAPIFIQMEPRPLLPGEALRTPVPSSAATQEATPAFGQIAASPTAPSASPDDRKDQKPSPLNPHIAAGAQPDAPNAPADPWQVTPETRRAAIARSLRTGPAGCRTLDGRLNPGEQQLCDDRFNEAAARARPLGPRTLDASEARREAQFARDGAAALAAHDGLRSRRAGVGVSGASPECIGGNLRGTCAGAYLRPEYQHSEDAPFGGTAAPR